MMMIEPMTRHVGQDAVSCPGQARSLYEGLYFAEPDASACEASRAYLADCLAQAGGLPCDLPSNESGLAQWMARRHEEVGRQYLEYLRERESGAPRRYFSNRSHALYFLRGVAPTKLVDGAWLYGLLSQWWDDRYHGLIRIYLEELGDGIAAENHVAMYRGLLAANGCEHADPLTDDHYVQGAIQLSLARNASHFVPEVVGFNLGYEQLPLHLLITTYELKELCIDPYYFQVHVTVDNAGTGHARKALEAVRRLRPTLGNTQDYYERVRRGYLLNELGASTLSVIASFNLHVELTRILVEKSAHGRHMHSDQCKVGGRTINDWLSSPDDIPHFLSELERLGWIKRHCEPAQSRFWRLLSEGADMFGVFSPYERQVIHDWIAGDALATSLRGAGASASAKPDRNLLRRISPATLGPAEVSAPPDAPGDFGAEMRDFEEHILQAADRRDLMDRLASMMDPSVHHSPTGFRATRMFSRLLGAA